MDREFTVVRDLVCSLCECTKMFWCYFAWEVSSQYLKSYVILDHLILDSVINRDYTRYLCFSSGDIIRLVYCMIDFVFLRAQKGHAQRNANISEMVMFHAMKCIAIDAQSYFT